MTLRAMMSAPSKSAAVRNSTNKVTKNQTMNRGFFAGLGAGGVGVGDAGMGGTPWAKLVGVGSCCVGTGVELPGP